MRIGVVTNAYHPFIGGIETHARQVSRFLADAGDDVEVLTQQSAGTTRRLDEVDGIAVRRFPLAVSATNYRFSVALWRWLHRNASRYDVLYAHGYHGLASLGAALTNSVPLVFAPHYHGTGHTRLRARLHSIYRPAGRRLLDRAGAVICVSAAERAVLVDDFPSVAPRVIVVPNGVEPRPLPVAPARPDPGKVRDGHKTLVAIGRIEAYKNLDAVLRALGRLPRRIRLTAVGVGPAADHLRELAADLGITEQVRFTGRVSEAELAAELAAADAFVSLSAHEAFGLAVADALASGLPVVVSDIPAHREVAELAGPEAWARLVDPADVPALASALGAAVEAPHRPSGTTTLPTWKQVAARVRAVLSEAVSDAGPHTRRAAG